MVTELMVLHPVILSKDFYSTKGTRFAVGPTK
jgi:hypothetical protein